MICYVFLFLSTVGPTFTLWSLIIWISGKSSNLWGVFWGIPHEQKYTIWLRGFVVGLLFFNYGRPLFFANSPETRKVEEPESIIFPHGQGKTTAKQPHEQ